MQTGVIFLQPTLIDSDYLSIVLDEHKVLQAPLEKRSLTELKQLQQHAKLVLIFPAQLAMLYHLAVPKLSDQKALTAITFFLETKISRSIQTLHLAYIYQQETQSYLIATVEKAIMAGLYQHFSQSQLFFSAIYIDATLLHQHECLYNDDHSFLIHAALFHGHVPSAFLPLYEHCFQTLSCYAFSELPSSYSATLQAQLIQDPPLVWLAKRAILWDGLNLCQGAFRSSPTHYAKKPVWFWGLLLGAVWFITFVLSQCIQIYQLHRLNTQLEARIRTASQTFFPNATKNIIHPTFQLSQYLKQAQSRSIFLSLMDALGAALSAHPFQLETISFQNNTLTITILTKSFDPLEDIAATLRAEKRIVVQRQATQRGQMVQTTLEISDAKPAH